MKEILNVRRSDGAFSRVEIGDVLDRLEAYVQGRGKIIVVTDSNIYSHYKNVIDRYERIIIGQGEENKTIATLEYIYGRLLAMGADRGSMIVGFGGGIVTDITGYAASTYMRGTHFGFVATTLLAQVDASVGGKNGVNFEGYKNMVGTFNQPAFVLCDISTLKTLPEKEFRSGLAEIIKSGLIADRRLFELFEKHDYSDFRDNEKLLFEAVTRAVKVKKHIVEQDERESGERKKLNLGHTFAHAIEKCTREFVHGEAVAIGLRIIADFSRKRGGITAEEQQRINSVLDRMGMPSGVSVPVPELLTAIRGDKKKEGDSIDLILMNGIGGCKICKSEFTEIEKMF